MELSAIQSAIEKHLASCAIEFGLDSGRVRAEYVLNPGGFVKPSFRITDGQKSLHLKLAGDSGDRQALRRWQELHTLLEQRYQAPRMTGWVALPGTDLEGPLCLWIDGKTPERLTPELAENVLPIVQRLHQDHDLAGYLSGGEAPGPCSRAYREDYHDRFMEDLKIIEADCPPFVSEALINWMRDEARRLEERVLRSAAFEEPAESPIHGDLWVNNLLVTDEGTVSILDWDGLCLGDPALDIAMLFGPCAADLRPQCWQALPAGLTARAAVGERLDLYAQASLLDWVIDVLADFVEADIAPQHAAQVRAEKEQIHRRALDLYRQLYG
jgi:hypothetical protein